MFDAFGHNFTPDEPCAGCRHGWHGEPCALRMYAAPSGATSYPNRQCPCPGVFGVLAGREVVA